MTPAPPRPRLNLVTRVEMTRKTVLIVEDDSDTRSIYTEVLERRGYRVLAAENGGEALDLARNHRPDLVLMDIRMPVMDGWHALAHLRSDPDTVRIPVWGVSAHFAQDTTARPGFARVLHKPLSAKDLVGQVEGFLGEA